MMPAAERRCGEAVGADVSENVGGWRRFSCHEQAGGNGQGG